MLGEFINRILILTNKTVPDYLQQALEELQERIEDNDDLDPDETINEVAYEYNLELGEIPILKNLFYKG